MEKYQRCFMANLKYFRLEKRVSQAQLAEACDVATGTIGNIECGIAKPSFDLLVAMAKSLGVSPADFFVSATTDEKGNIKDVFKERKLLLEIYEKLKTHFEK